MLQLQNGCSCSELSVSPKNWKTGGASILKKEWFIQYYFHDPAFKDKYKHGYQARVKGMNRFKTLKERRQATIDLLANEEMMLLNEGYNPITKGNNVVKLDFEIDPETPFVSALIKTNEKLHVERHTTEDIKSVINGIEAAAKALGYLGISISEIRRRHMKNMLEFLQKTNPRFTANTFNKYRSYLMILFKELVEMEACDSNPLREISKQRCIVKLREVPTPEEMALIDAHLKNKTYPFWRFCNIFFHSGARGTELLKIKASHVDLLNQRYKVTIIKGRFKSEVWKTIKTIALPLWQEVVDPAGKDDYLFSDGLVPGTNLIRADQISKRWKRHVKGDLKIDADFYSLKHLNTTEVVDMLGAQVAANLNSHTSVAMVNAVYDVKRKERKHDILKDIANPFSR